MEKQNQLIKQIYLQCEKHGIGREAYLSIGTEDSIFAVKSYTVCHSMQYKFRVAVVFFEGDAYYTLKSDYEGFPPIGEEKALAMVGIPSPAKI